MRHHRVLVCLLLSCLLVAAPTHADDPPPKPAAPTNPKATKALADRDAAAKKVEDDLATHLRDARSAFANKLEAAIAKESNAEESGRSTR